jgi:hypothetical protein
MGLKMNNVEVNKQVRSEVDRIDTRQKRERIPFGVPQAKHGVRYDVPGYFLRFIDDIGGRIEKAIEGGYQFVSKKEVFLENDDRPNADLGDRVSHVVGHKQGSSYRSYLMKISNELREEDKKILSDRRAERMNGIKRGPTDKSFYTPNGSQLNISSSFKP